MKLIFDSIIYNNNLVLNSGEIDLDGPGIYYIKGINGAGKTSLVRQLKSRYSSYISLMDQDNIYIIKDKSVLENIAMYNVKQQVIESMLTKYGLDYILEKKSKKLSGGEKRLISLLRTLFSKTSIIILDEPLNDLDYQVLDKVNSLITEVATQKSIILISHYNTVLSVNQNYIIENKILSNNTPIRTTTNLSELEYKEVLLDKYNHKSVLYPFFILILLYFSLFSLYTQIEFKTYDQNFDNVYFIASTSSINAIERVSQGAIETTTLRCMYKANSAKCMQDARENSTIKTLDNIDSISNLIYPLEFYNQEERSYHSLHNYIAEKYFKSDEFELTLTNINENINTNANEPLIISKDIMSDDIGNRLKEYNISYTIDNGSSNTIVFPLNKDIYNDFIEEYKGFNILDGFIIADQNSVELIIKTIINEDGILIVGDYVSKLLSEAMNLMTIKGFIFRVLQYSALTTFLVGLILIINEKTNMYIYKLLFNYGYAKETIKSMVIESYRFKLIYKLNIIAILLLTLYCFMTNNATFSIIVLTLFCLTLYRIIKFIVIFYIKRKVLRVNK